eukprot:1136713-Pelagomonas_calceolata.AAC.4
MRHGLTAAVTTHAKHEAWQVSRAEVNICAVATKPGMRHGCTDAVATNHAAAKCTLVHCMCMCLWVPLKPFVLLPPSHA